MIVQVIRADVKHNSSECGKSMNICLVVVYMSWRTCLALEPI